MKPPVDDPWSALRRLTPARIALGRAGDGLPTEAWLQFGVAHAAARDAVHVALDCEAVRAQVASFGHFCAIVKSAARDRAEFLRRPDLGRRLDADSRERVAHGVAAGTQTQPITWVLADGLSARAIETHAVPMLEAAARALELQAPGPIVIAREARVALGDEIGELLATEFVVVMIGERPGLSSPDSLGIYLTHRPRVGRLDSERNCISNIRAEGLPYEVAAATLARLIGGARRLGATGVLLKDESGAPAGATLGAPHT